MLFGDPWGPCDPYDNVCLGEKETDELASPYAPRISRPKSPITGLVTI